MDGIPLIDGAALRPLAHPARADAADDEAFVAYARVRNAVRFETTGRVDEHVEPHALIALVRSDDDMHRRQWSVIDRQGETIGLAALDVVADDGGRTAYLTVDLLRRTWGRGVGSAALRVLEDLARREGVERLLVWAEHSGDEPRLASPTGFGSVPRDHSARFLARHGFTLEQVERVSSLRLDGHGLLPRLSRLHEEATRLAHAYRVVSWTLPTPAEHVEGYAWMKSRMSTDAPDAELGMPEETWDAERVARHDGRYLDLGNTVLVTAAQHRESGELCAFNELSVGPEHGRTTHQEDTLVLGAHRGHRLGMLVKTAGLLAWRTLRPDSPEVITYNAEENRPMLSINEEIGFAPIAYEGAWKKDLSLS